MIDARIPLMAAQGSQVNLVDMYRQAQQMKAMEEERAYRREVIEEQRQARIGAAQREQAGMIAKLTANVTDEATYQQRLAAARAYGIDVSSAPQNYDPQWVQTQNAIAQFILKPDAEQKLTNMALELRDAGFEPGTPEFEAQMRQRITASDSKVVSTTAGGMAGMVGPNGQYNPFILPNDGSHAAGAPAKTVVRTGKDANGRTVVQYSDGSIEYAGEAGSNASGGF